MEEKDILLSMEKITKTYSNGVSANKDIDFLVRKGEIHALMGENGAGKSTLMKVLFGNEQPDDGTIKYNNKKVQINSPNDAIELGIGMVHQHFDLIPSLTVAENIVLGNEPGSNIFFDKKKAFKVTEQLSEKYKFDLDVTAKVEDISVGKKQKVEILKTLYRETKLLILDEPTAVLTPQETEELFEQLKILNNNEITIIFISHKLDEIKKICHNMTIMRRGRSMGTYAIDEVTQQNISKLMVGRDVVLKVDKSQANPGKNVLDVKNISYKAEDGSSRLKTTSFSLHSGEIIGIAGVDGSGQQEIVNIITGMVEANETSEIKLCGESIKKENVKYRRKKGLAYIPEDRIEYGIADNFTIKESLISSTYDSSNINGTFLMNQELIKENAIEKIKEYDIRCENEEQAVGMLSGGNIQKVIVAREFSTKPKVLIAAQPTRGVDVGAIEFIHKKIVEIRDKGCGVILVSADLNEILELSDSVIVMDKGEMTGFFKNAQELTEEELGYYMLGMKKQEEIELKEAYDA